MPHRTYSPPGDDPILEPIAICGMACRLPGGVDSPSSFWEMLVKKQSGQTQRVPESRFNIDAYYHSNLERPGSFNVPGGYFLDGHPEDFDPTAFNMTPIEAQWLDPQQRKILEVAYECLENAGLPLESVAGSNTAVFIGSFTSDYQQMSIREPDFRHNYAATGVDPGIISNRVGNVFNLKGPSFTINTACSSSIYAIHNACNSLRAQDCDAALVGGVNLIITVDQHMNTAKLGILSPTSTCHTFDAAADGYGRAEGAGALYLKRLRDAIRNGDAVRGVIRATAVNTNGKVEGMGITHPSVKGQESVVRMAYKKAGLDPDATVYAELHGTGTPVGDPIETRAISNAMNDTRSAKKPLLLGAVKPNIGHSEAASGIFAVMKACLMTEAGVIPGVAHFKQLNPAILEEEWNVKVNVDTTPWPQGFDARRVSVSSFGYGGTNGHVIIESVESLYPWYQHARVKRDTPNMYCYDRPFLLCFSGHDKATLARNITAINKVSGNYYAIDLAYTLNLNRTQWNHRAFVMARDAHMSPVFDQSAIQSGVASPVAPKIGFLFTGQGAQWAGMGQVAAKTFPSFLRTMRSLDHILARLEEPPSFRLVDLLQASPDSMSRVINQTEVAQPLCTAIQISLVDLFSEWGVTPSVSVGHSSGEIATAYAAGLLSAPEAMLVAYCRGRAVLEHSGQGSMLAVGLGVDAVQEYLAPYASEELCIACENSPSSVTLSGLSQHIREIKGKLDNAQVFARELKTGRAYHSPHMAAVGVAYDKMLVCALKTLNNHDLCWRRPRSAMISSLKGQVVDMAMESPLPPSYWSENLRSRVLFDTAVRTLGTDQSFQQVKLLVEVGPHAALAGPFKQICLSNKFEHLRYIASLVRGKDDADQLLSVAGSLFVANYPVDLEAVNAVEETNPNLGARKPKSHRLLVDLPPYQWNYEKRYWAEPRTSAEQRSLIQPRHDLLGRQITGLSTKPRLWRNVLRHRDLPWLKDHALGDAAVFPAAGYMALAIEALRQVAELHEWPVGQICLRDVNISTTLVVPETDAGVEITLRLDALSDEQPGADASTPWYSFSVESLFEGKWVSHCRGKISSGPEDPVKYQCRHLVDPSRLTQCVPSKRWYESFGRVGFSYGPTFQQLGQVHINRRYQEAEAEVRVRNHSDVVQEESRYVIHPGTIDACLQLIIISIHCGKLKEMPWGVVPILFEQVTLRLPSAEDEECMGKAVAWTERSEGRYFNTHTQLIGQRGRFLVDVKNLRCVAYEAAVPANAANSALDPAPFMTVSWKPDVLRLLGSSHSALWTKGASEVQVLASIVQIIHHWHPLASALLCTQNNPEVRDAVSGVLPKLCNVGVVQPSELEDSDHFNNTAVASPPDLIVVDQTVAGRPELLLGLAKQTRWLIQSHPGKIPSSMTGIRTGIEDELPLYPLFEVPEVQRQKESRHIRVSAARGIGRMSDDATHDEQRGVTILHAASQTQDQHLIAQLSGNGHTVTGMTVDQFTLPAKREKNEVVILDDRHASLLSQLNEHSFERLKSLIRANVPMVWLTRGVRQGSCVFGGMVQGFLRVIRSENASARLVQLDVDQEEAPADVAEALLSILWDCSTKDSGKDTEFWLHKGVMNIGRVVPNHALNREWAPATSLTSRASDVSPLPYGVRLKAVAVDGQLELTDDEPEASYTLGSDEIEIQVLGSELPASPNAAAVVFGRVLRRGSSVGVQVATGDQVIGWTTDSLTTVVRTACYIRWDSSIKSDTMTILASMAALYKVVNMCMATAGVNSSDRILALPGPEPTINALVQLGKAMGWKVSLVARSLGEQEECSRKFGLDACNVLLFEDISAAAHMREEKSRWVILAHDFSRPSQELWRQIPARSVFVLNEVLLETAPDPLPFSRGSLFIPTSLTTLDAAAVSGILQQALHLVQKYPGLLGNMASVHDISEFCQHKNLVREIPVNKVGIVTYRYGDSVVQLARKPPRLSFSSDASYLLVGCLGGLGRSLTRFMMERGARHFVFVSRSGTNIPEAAQVVNLVTCAGAAVQVFCADATSESEMAKIVQEVHAQRPIRGVVHAAMVLRDGVFEQMDCPRFQAAVDPKVRGAMSISKAVQGLDLDFFVMTSSISATLGNPGQTNYSAANSFLDTLAWQRRLNQQPGVSLVLPMVLDVGVVAENEAIEASLLRKGMYGIGEQEMLRGFEVAMFRDTFRDTFRDMAAAPAQTLSLEDVGDTQIILGLEPAELVKAIHSDQTVDAYWYQDARFVHLRAEVEHIGQTTSPTSSSSSGRLQSLVASLAGSLGFDDILTKTAQHIAQRVGSILLISAQDFDLDGPSIASYGLDSMIGAELRNWLFKEFALEFSFQKLLSQSLTFKALAEVVARHLGLIDVD